MQPHLPIYLDNAATTPLDPRILDAMIPFFITKFGNPASQSHSFGREAERATEEARSQIAELIGATTRKEIIFTSGATESNNLAIKGVASFYRNKGNHIITCTTEHKSVLDPCRKLQGQGYDVTYVEVDNKGCLDPEDIRRAINPKTILISIMLANNELGTLHPIKEIGHIAHDRGVPFHCDAVQGLAKVEFDVHEMQVDLASISAHKMYGPKGIGALFIRRANPRVQLHAEIDGGGHERGLRSGTLNVPAIAGFGKAAELALAEWRMDSERIFGLRKILSQRIFDSLDGVSLNGADDPFRTPGHLNLSFDFVEAEALMMAMKDIAVSSGSACTSNAMEPSHVLKALGLSEQRRQSSIRFGIGKFNTQEEIEFTADTVIDQVNRIRAASPLYEMHKHQ